MIRGQSAAELRRLVKEFYQQKERRASQLLTLKTFYLQMSGRAKREHTSSDEFLIQYA